MTKRTRIRAAASGRTGVPVGGSGRKSVPGGARSSRACRRVGRGFDQPRLPAETGAFRRKHKMGWSQPVSRVLSWIAIHLGATSPSRSSSLPGNSAGHAIVPLFGLAPGGVYRATSCCHACGALLPHPFTLTCAALRWPSAVYSLLHFPSTRAAQALPGTVPYGARTFLDVHEERRDNLANSGGGV